MVLLFTLRSHDISTIEARDCELIPNSAIRRYIMYMALLLKPGSSLRNVDEKLPNPGAETTTSHPCASHIRSFVGTDKLTMFYNLARY